MKLESTFDKIEVRGMTDGFWMQPDAGSEKGDYIQEWIVNELARKGLELHSQGEGFGLTLRHVKVTFDMGEV